MEETTALLSATPDGAPGDGDSSRPSISADGRFVAFRSTSSDLVDGDTNGERDNFVRDTLEQVTTRVSVADDGTEANGDNSTPVISADGRAIAFESEATNLVDDDTNGVSDVFVRVLGTSAPQYGFSGFLGSVSDAPTVNHGTGGRTYPIRWRLTDEGGDPVTSTDAVEAVAVHRLGTCGEFDGEPTASLEETATGRTGLRYDTDTGQFVYNWKTPRGAACYRLEVHLDDDTVHTALFELR